MNKNLFIKVVSLVVLFIFIYPAILPALEVQDKLAAYSRFTKYFSPDGKNDGLLNSDSILLFGNAMSALNTVILDPSKTEENIEAAIRRQGDALKSLGVRIDNNTVYTKQIETRKVRYIVLIFNGHARSVYFLRDYNEWTSSELAQLGITTEEDKDNLKVPGVAGLWITKYEPMQRGLGAGEEVDNSIDKLLDLIITDILTNKLNTNHKRAILRRSKEPKAADLIEVKWIIEYRLQQISLAIREEVFWLIEEHVLTGSPRWSLKKRREHDYFTETRTLQITDESTLTVEVHDRVISNADAFKELLDKLVKDALKRLDLEVIRKRLETFDLGFYYTDYVKGDVIRDTLRAIGLDRLLDDNLYEETVTRMTNQLLVDPEILVDGLETKKDAMLAKIREKAGELIGATERGLVAGEEGDEGRESTAADEPLYSPPLAPASHFDNVMEAEYIEYIAIDYMQWEFIFMYYRNRDTGNFEEAGKYSVTDDSLPLPAEALTVFRDNKLQVVFTSRILSGWNETVRKAAGIISANLGAVKTPNSIVYGEGLTLQVDEYGIIYVIPNAEARDIASVERLVQITSKVQSHIAKIPKAQQLKGFIDIDSRVFGIQVPSFQEILYRKLQELYNEGLSVVRVVGEPIELTGDMKVIIGDFNERAGSDEWRTVTSSKANTATLVSSDNTALADERQATSTVIRLGGFDGLVNMPQIFPAITIARAIIAVGGEENVTGGLFNDVKALYLSMVGEELREEVSGATTIAQLLAIVLPPITAEDLRIYEYLLLGRKIAEVAA